MNQQLRFIVDSLNQPPYNKRFNLVSFDSLDSFSLLQVLNDVLSEASPEHKIDLRDEPPEQTAIRIFSFLRILKYKPESDQGGGLNTFRQGLLEGSKTTIYPLLQWLLERMEELKKRAYLARFLVRIEVPPEHLQDDTVSEVHQTYQDLMEQFKELHKGVEQQRKSQFNVGEVRKDIAAMEEEKEQLVKRIERLKRKAAGVPNHAEMLEAAMKLRREKDRELELSEQRVEQKNHLLHAQQRAQYLQQQLRELKSSSIGLTPDGLVRQLEDENKLKGVLVRDTLPKKIESQRVQCIELEKVLLEPIMSDADLDAIRQQIEEANEEVSRLVAKHMPGNDPVKAKLALFRQQASIIAHKRESAAENYKATMDELAVTEKELESKRRELKEAGGGEVIREDEFKRYVARLRTLNTTYKKKKAELSALKAEFGVLARTEELLKSRDENLDDLAAFLDQKRKKEGQASTQHRPGSPIDPDLGPTEELDEQAQQELHQEIQHLSATIAEKKASLAPSIKEIRPLRQRHQELQGEHAQRKVAYDTVAAGLESKRSHLEQEVRAYWEEMSAEESRYHYLQCMLKSVQLHQQRVAQEMKCYVSSDATEKRRSLRDQLTRKIQEQENLGKALRDKQKEVRETHGDSMKQVKMWKDLRTLFELKRQSFLQGQQQRQQAQAAHDAMMQAENRLVLS